MRTWTLGPGDPLVLSLAADFRLCSTDTVNDQIWELKTGGDPPALAACTTYGLRARLMRIFPRFTLDGQPVADPAAFPLPPRLRYFSPNFLHLDFSPFPDIDVIAEYWVPDSHCLAGRYTITNHAGQAHTIMLEICAQLNPLEGQSLAPRSTQTVNILAGRTSNLAPVIFLTGGPRPGPGPFPSLVTALTLPPGGSHSLTWAHAALPDMLDSFELARRTAARTWQAERTRIEMVNHSQTIEIHTGEPDWDAAFALSQKIAFSLFLSSGQYLPHPSFVIARQPDHGYSPRQDGMDHSSLWGDQSPLEASYISSLLPGAPELAAGLVRNFLAFQTRDGAVDWKPGLAGQHGRWLAAPLLASLAWQVYQHTLDQDFLKEIQPGLDAFAKCWFTGQHDRDQDGFPEWDHPLQTGLEDNPAFTVWGSGGQGADISAIESPALSAMLCHELHSQALIAHALDQPQEFSDLESKSEQLRLLTEQCWHEPAVLYHNRDRTTHRSPAGKTLARQVGTGKIVLEKSFPQPVRLIVRIDFKGDTTRLAQVILKGLDGDTPRSERLERIDFQWGAGLAVATSQTVFTWLDEVEVFGAQSRDRVSVQVMDFTGEDISLFLPLWAHIPSPSRARGILDQTLFAADRFDRPFGIPDGPSAAPSKRLKEPGLPMPSARQAVHLPWNVFIAEGLLAYGFQEQAAHLTRRLMAAVIQNLKRQHAFYHSYDAGTGTGLGERNAVQGLAPLGLFLDVLGVKIQTPRQVSLSGKNPFPWPVTVKYRDLTVTRQAEQTLIVFPNGQTFTSPDPTDAVVSAD